ncbi:hybrid sensor histidine kinase/response regulator [Jidongwangia harbinensis]|uniref:hybrid sensor histidine kinase/response regulator n=1 Tax=Jidongwangia harbinensis TaxID=2878561 RepID=UPI001CD9B41B|nr:response regulator [Jidongwangia harbinensis]MCA2218527.1 response regulator [Jidongwangia harbinensis]
MSPPGATVRIVLVEDQAADAALVEALLSEAADETFVVEHFTRLGPARDHLGARGADCVLLDLSLPDAEGYDAVQELRRDVSGVPLVVLSGRPDRDLMVAVLRAGAQDYLVKGTVDGEQLARAIRHAIERKRIEEALRHSERQMRWQQDQSRLIIQSAGDPFVSMDVDGLITDWNDRAEQVFGWERHEVIGRPLAETLIPPAMRDAHRTGLRRLLDGGRPRLTGRRVEVPALHRSGRELPVELSIWQVGVGADRHFHAFMHDITERLELQTAREHAQAQAERDLYERRLHQAQRLESLGQLAGGVAHDFNNLLAVIVNYLEFVAEDVAAAAARDPATWKRTGEDVDQIRRTTERATRLVQQLLTFGRRDIAQPEVLDIAAVVAEVEQLLLRTIGERVELRTATEPGLWRVRIDSGQLEQILVNLVVNARDAMPTGGRVTVSGSNVTLDEHAAAGFAVSPGRYARLDVTDTGVGMTRETADRIFEPFFTSKPLGAGTGLGLATVYGIVTNVGGQVRVDSEPGRGTTMTVLLPATDEAPASAAEAPAPAARRGGDETILLAEDEPALREVTRRILERHGYRVLAAEDGAAAVALARRHVEDVDLLLTDVVMPGLNGPLVAEALTALKPRVRILFMSGYAPGLTEDGTLGPDVALIAKPFAEAALLDRVRQILDSGPP